MPKNQSHDPYTIYARTVGKVASGTQLTTTDFGFQGDGFEFFDEAGQVAVALAADDVRCKNPLRTKADFLERLKNLQGA